MTLRVARGRTRTEPRALGFQQYRKDDSLVGKALSTYSQAQVDKGISQATLAAWKPLGAEADPYKQQSC